MQEIKDYIDKIAALLPVTTSISIPEAEKRAGGFLSAQASITNWRHLLSKEKIKLTTLQSAIYSQQLNQCTGKTVTENKLTVEASSEYSTAREALEDIENDLSYLKAYYEIFSNLSKENY
jgi:hypothetical protein